MRSLGPRTKRRRKRRRRNAHMWYLPFGGLNLSFLFLLVRHLSSFVENENSFFVLSDAHNWPANIRTEMHTRKGLI